MWWCMQVLDTKGMHVAYPKVALQTPFRDSMDTTGAGAQHQELLGFSPCSAEKAEDTGRTAAAAAAGADVVYFYKPQADCSAEVSVCSSVMATELAVFSGVDNVRTPGLDLERATAVALVGQKQLSRGRIMSYPHGHRPQHLGGRTSHKLTHHQPQHTQQTAS